jgi:hypothetical protein
VVRGWVLFWCVQSFAWAWDAPAAYLSEARELAPDPYSPWSVLAPDPYLLDGDLARKLSLANRRTRAARAAAARLAPSPYPSRIAALAPMPYEGRMPARELARPRAQPLALAGSPYERAAGLELAPDPY